MRTRSACGAIALALVLAVGFPAPRAAASGDAGVVDPGCSITGGTLTMLATDNAADFAAFALFGDDGKPIAQQFIPLYSPGASAELMLTQLGFGTKVASATCLADSNVQRCTDPAWPAPSDGAAVELAGVSIGPDWAIVSIVGHAVADAKPAAIPLDGAFAGMQLDDQPVRWSSFYDSQTSASQAFFGIKPGSHRLTIGSRDPATGTFAAQDRICFTL